MKTIWGHMAKKSEAYPSEIKRSGSILCRNCPQVGVNVAIFLNWKPTERPSGHVRAFCTSCKLPVWVDSADWHVAQSKKHAIH